MRQDRYVVAVTCLGRIMDPSRLLPRRTVYAKLADQAFVDGSIASRRTKKGRLSERFDRWTRERVGRGNLPYGGSWHYVEGQRKHSLVSKNARELRQYLKTVDRYCKNNPPTTFRYRPADTEEAQDAVVTLQVLGVAAEQMEMTLFSSRAA